MDELEHRLRSALTEMAGEVSPSHHAWQEQQRRLAVKSRRARLRPALMAAVAAVVALIAIPVVIINLRTDKVDLGAVPLVSTPPELSQPRLPAASERGKGPEYRSVNGEQLITDVSIVSIETFDSSQYQYTYVYAIRSPKQELALCVASGVDGTVINGPEQAKFGAPQCTPLTPPKTGYLWVKRNVSTPSSKGTWLYVMSKPADNLMLRRNDESIFMAQRGTVAPDFVVFIAYMGTNDNRPPKAFTVRDVNNNVLQNGQ